MKKLVHLSLFPNGRCVVCQKNIKINWIHCPDCLDKYLQSKEDDKK